jgi:protein-S-isoprenylcysteine O-methyltransferase Ste14
MRSPIEQLITSLWMAVFLLWAITALTSRRSGHARFQGGARLANWIVGIAWWVLFSRGRAFPVLARRFLPMTPALSYLGLALTVLGLAFAVWSRFYLGRNWSAVVTVKEDHQLKRSGPYAIVRHPIYSGFMLATLGSAIAFGELGGLLAAVLIVAAWGYKARLEEAAMIEQFGAEYENYRREVKGLVPFLW